MSQSVPIRRNWFQGRIAPWMAVVVVTGLAAPSVRGQVFDRPPSYRGDPHSVNVVFDTGSTTPLAFSSVPGTYPLDTTPPSSTLIGPDFVLSIDLPNFVDPFDTKLMRIQSNFFQDPATAPVPRVTSISSSHGSTVDPAPPVSLGNLVLIPGGASNEYSAYLDFVLHPNPDFETIVVEFPSGTDPIDLVFDTVSIPEPSSVALLSIGAGLLLWRSRRRAGV